MSEIKLRAIAQIAKLSRELETNERARTDLPLSGKRQTTKEEQIREAGLGVSTVRRYEQLAAPTEELKPVFAAAGRGRALPIRRRRRRRGSSLAGARSKARHGHRGAKFSGGGLQTPLFGRSMPAAAGRRGRGPFLRRLRLAPGLLLGDAFKPARVRHPGRQIL